MKNSFTGTTTTPLFLRYEKVFEVLFKYGFEDILAHPPLKGLVPSYDVLVPKRRGKRFDKYSRYERIRMVCEELGTTYIKFAQIASNRPDLLPEPLIEELAKLQSNVPPVSWEEIQTVLQLPENEAVLKLAKIEKEPIASASIAQVHRGTIFGNREVVFKIQRPGIKATIEADLKILWSLATAVENYFPQSLSFQPKGLVRMFERSIRKELQFQEEAKNLLRFNDQFEGNPNIYVPELYADFCSANVLCMEYIEGKKITDKGQQRRAGVLGSEIARKGIDLYFEQVFDHGFFHADPHPGNIFLLEDGRICMIDYGMMGTVIERDKILMGDLLLAVHEEDVQGFKRALLKFCDEENLPNEVHLEYDIIDFLASYKHKSIAEIDNEEIIRALNSLFFEYKIRIPENLLLLLKTLVIIEGVGLQLNPEFNIIENIQPFVQRLLKRKFNPQNLRKTALKSTMEMVDLMTQLPKNLSTIFAKAGKGKLHMEFEHKGLEPFNQTLEIISNRLSFALVLCAMIIGSSLLVLAKMPPFIYGIPVLGFIGFVVSAFLALRLVISILKHGNF